MSDGTPTVNRERAGDIVVEHDTVREFRIAGATCALCGGGAYPPWHTDDETWRRVMGDSQQQVCLPCFYDRANTNGDPLHVSLDGALVATLERRLRHSEFHRTKNRRSMRVRGRTIDRLEAKIVRQRQALRERQGKRVSAHDRAYELHHSLRSSADAAEESGAAPALAGSEPSPTAYGDVT